MAIRGKLILSVFIALAICLGLGFAWDRRRAEPRGRGAAMSGKLDPSANARAGEALEAIKVATAGQ